MPTVTSTQTFIASLEGTAYVSGVNDTFSAIQAATGNTTDTNHGNAGLTASTTTNQFAQLKRVIIVFNTSTLPSTATVTAVTLTVPALIANTTLLGTTTLEIVSSNPASNSSLAATDYGTLGSTSYASTSQSSLSTSSSNTFTLNSNGRSNITLAGYSKFGAILGWDLNNSFTGTWASGIGNSIEWLTGNTTLSVTYTQPTMTITGISSITGATSVTGG